MNSKILLVTVIVVGCCALEALAKPDLPDPDFLLNSDLKKIDPSDDTVIRKKFEQFKTLYNRTYSNKDEEELRYEIFKKNLKQAIEKKTYKLDKTADRSAYEIGRDSQTKTPEASKTPAASKTPGASKPSKS